MPKRNFGGTNNALLFDLIGTYIGIFTLWQVIVQYTDMCAFLCVLNHQKVFKSIGGKKSPTTNYLLVFSNSVFQPQDLGKT